MRRDFFIALAALSFLAAPARAEHLTALSMHGAPKYAPGFTHPDYASASAPKGGALRLAKNGSFNNLNKNIILGNTPDEWLEHINDTLMQRAWNEPFTLYGLAAESVDVAPDRSWIVFHLNHEARFHDGAPMTAEDVKFSYETLRNYGHPVRRRVYGLVSKVEILGRHDIKFTFGPGHDRESVMILALMPVLPKHYWARHDVTKTTLEPPLGSGPYRVSFVAPGRRIIYARVKDYWGKDLPVNRGMYNFDTVTYNFYRDDSIALESFKGGDYDLRREYDIKKWNTGYDFPAVRSGKVRKEEIAHRHPEWLKAFIFNTRRAPFGDARVREALGLMFDYAWLNRALYFGEYKVIDSTFMNSELAASGKPEGEELDALSTYKKDLPPEAFGPAWRPPGDDLRENKRRAIALLKEAGWSFKDEALVNAKGEPLAFELLLGDPGDEKLALEFSRMLKTIGVAARVRTVDNAQFTGRLQEFDYDMVSFKWLNSLSPGNEQLNYWGSAAAGTKGSRNYAGVSNPAIDALASGIAAAQSREALVARAHALDRALMWGHYFVPLFYSGKDRVAYDASLQRPDVTPAYGVILESWWRKP
jgi:microcin C transport system substrate-binding protein